MKTTVMITKEKRLKFAVAKILLKWVSAYITAMSKVLYPSDMNEVQCKYDRNGIFMK